MKQNFRVLYSEDKIQVLRDIIFLLKNTLDINNDVQSMYSFTRRPNQRQCEHSRRNLAHPYLLHLSLLFLTVHFLHHRTCF